MGAPHDYSALLMILKHACGITKGEENYCPPESWLGLTRREGLTMQKCFNYKDLNWLVGLSFKIRKKAVFRKASDFAKSRRGKCLQCLVLVLPQHT